MAGSAMKVIIFIVSLALGIGITMLATDLIPGLDDQIKIIAGIVVTISMFACLYFVTKGSGS